ncbi:ferrous iron transport protein A [Hydrogenophaga sp.]|uniref:FeoA family protein n=1 Tax=Hydrogenophaga sp. TaxID=1904254 RepID=UPI003566D74E
MNQIAPPTVEQGLHQWPSQILAEVTGFAPTTDAEDQDVLRRLLEIGFLPGETVRVVARSFPRNDPIAVRVGHTTFALRSREAALIRVRSFSAWP